MKITKETRTFCRYCNKHTKHTVRPYNKKVVEKAAEMKKVVFLAVGQLMRIPPKERGFRVSRMRKIILASHKMGARVALVSLADSETMLLSTMQMMEVARLLFKEPSGLFGGDVL